MDPQSRAWMMETTRLLGNSQALVLANLAHALAQTLGITPSELAEAMTAMDMHHDDERVEVLAAGMRRVMIDTLRSGAPILGSA